MKNKTATRYYSSLQEQYVAEQLGGEKTTNSGASHFVSGDVIIPNTMVIECKTTTKDGAKSWSIKKEWLEQVIKERLDLMLPYCALAISKTPSGDDNMYVIDEKLMKMLVEVLRGEEN